MKKDGISVIVCCYNSSLRLLPTLTHLAKQKTTIPFEVIVVDNASNDDTFLNAQIMSSIFKSSVSFKVIKELQQGLSYARNKGIKEAAYEYIVFCDDDNWLEENYIQIAHDFLFNNPNYAAIGGKSEAVFEDGKIPPTWFKALEASYAVGVQGVEGNITSKGYLWGAGISLRKSLYVKVINNDFPLLLTGRKGTNLSSGEDTEFCLRCVLLGYEVYYTSKLQLQHFISSSRLSRDYSIKLLDGMKNTTEVLSKYFFYINVRKSNNNFKHKFRLLLKYLLYLLNIRKLTPVDIKLIYSLTPYKLNTYDEGFQFIRKLGELSISNSTKF